MGLNALDIFFSATCVCALLIALLGPAISRYKEYKRSMLDRELLEAAARLGEEYKKSKRKKAKRISW